MSPLDTDTDTRALGGPVQVFTPFPEMPGFVFARTAARSPAFPANDAAGGAHVLIGSAAGTDAADVGVRAAGELSERVHNVLSGTRADAAAGAVVAGYPAVHRAALDPVGLGAAPELRDVTQLWVPGRSLLSGAEVLVPAAAVFLGYRSPSGPTGPRPGSTGIAAHSGADGAVRHAVVEVLERDLISDAWYRAGARSVLTGPPRLPPVLADGLAALGLTATVLALPGPGDTGCVLVCLHDARRGAQSFGARATTSLSGAAAVARAAEAAVHEALMVRWSTTSPAGRAAWQRMTARPAGPHGPVEHALHTFHRQDSLTHLLDGAVPRSWPDAGPAGPAADTAALLAERTGGDVVVVDTTVAAFGPPGTVVVRVVAPGAHRLPADERDVPPGARTRLPHPLG